MGLMNHFNQEWRQITMIKKEYKDRGILMNY